MLTAYRAALPGISLLCGIAAFVLAMCCLLAGTNPKTLPNMELYTLNTSRIGSTIQSSLGLPPPDPSFNFSTMLPRDISDTFDKASDAIQTKGSDITDDAKDAIKDPAAAIKNLKASINDTVTEGKQQLDAAASKVKDAAKNATSKIVSTFINKTMESLTIGDFYASHLLTYCEGEYIKNGKENITYCSNNKPKNSWNVTNSTKSALTDPFAFIDDLKLPDPIALAMKAITLLSKVIAALYIIGIVASFFSLITSGFLIPAALTTVSKGSFLRWGSFLFSLGAFLSLLLGTILIHFLCNRVCGFFDEHPHLGVAATHGRNFMGCSIAATVFMAVALSFAMADLAVDRMMKGAKDNGKGLVKKGLSFGLRKRKQKQQEKGYDMEERV